MRSTVSLILAAFTAFPLIVAAGTVELPGLQGDYTGNDPSRSVVIDLGGQVEDLTSMSLELHGFFDTSWTSETGIPVSWCASFVAAFYETEPGFWMAGVASDDREGEFHATVDFSSLFGATWEFLAEGAGVLNFAFEPCAAVGSNGTQDWSLGPIGAIYSATLVFDGTVDEDVVSFSRIKALYR